MLRLLVHLLLFNHYSYYFNADFCFAKFVIKHYRVYGRGHKFVLDLTQTHFSPSHSARVTMSFEKGTQFFFFMAKGINYSIIINLEGIDKIKPDNKIV